MNQTEEKKNYAILCPINCYPLTYRYIQNFSKYIKPHPAVCLSGSHNVEMPLKSHN